MATTIGRIFEVEKSIVEEKIIKEKSLIIEEVENKPKTRIRKTKLKEDVSDA